MSYSSFPNLVAYSGPVKIKNACNEAGNLIRDLLLDGQVCLLLKARSNKRCIMGDFLIDGKIEEGLFFFYEEIEFLEYQ